MVAVVAQQEGSHLTLIISGRFTFSLYKEFFPAYKELPQRPASVDVDLAAVEYIDSAALGMLLSMRNYFGPEARLRLLNAPDMVRRVLEIACFDKQFELV
jgi:HptB-dependent secretion and biofilm anti anti-sigma factor